jgi:hypothetical protein
MQRQLVRWTCGCWVLGLAAAWCWADGGAVRAIERDGPFQISAFTSPNPLVAGPADISVLVQNAATLELVADADVQVVIKPRGRAYGAIARPATTQAATNKLFRACLVELEAGWYDVVVTCRADRGRGQVRFALEVGAAGTQLATLWPWFTWPAVPVVLFGLHQILSRKRPSRRGARMALGTAGRDVYNERAGGGPVRAMRTDEE